MVHQVVTSFAQYRVVLVRINHHIELFACVNQLANHLHSVLHMNIVVCRAVNNQQLTFESVSKVNR